MNNTLIFGKDDTKNIVNISLKDNEAYIYTQTTEGNVNLEKFPYNPWVLTRDKVKPTSERLKGDQYWKYITPTTCIKFRELQKKYQRDLWMPRNLEETITLELGLTYFKGMKVEDVSILSFDIETSGLVMDTTSQVFLISNTFRKGKETTSKLFCIDDYVDQRDMIEDWCDWVCENDPSIITGHNVLSYDFPYLNNIWPLHLGRDGSDVEFEEKTSKFRKDGSQQYDYHNVKIIGREIVDTFFLSMKYDIGRNFPSYGLKPIIKYLGLEKTDRTFIDASKIKLQWPDKELREKIKQYAIEDADDALKLFDLMIPSYFYLAQSIPKTMQQMINEASGSQLDALMVRSYLQDGYSQPQTSKSVPFEGAISMGIPGVYKHVLKSDIASLYPSIMLEYNIHDSKKDPNNHMIKMLNYFREERLNNKKLAKETGDKYYDNMQEAQKILINSMYGFLGAGYLLYNYPKGAAEVTRKGREILLKGVEWSTGYTLDRVVKSIVNKGKEDEHTEYEWKLGSRISDGMGYDLVNIDTDSFSLTKGTVVDTAEFAIFLEKLNSLYSKLIRWENDGIYEKVIVIRAKNYVLVKDGKIKYKGSAITDQKKEFALTEMLQEFIQLILNNQRLLLYSTYNKYIKEALDIKDINRWSAKKTVTKSVLSPERLTEQKVLNAINETIKCGVIENVSEGDKVWLYNAIDGETPAMAKGEVVKYKDGRIKMVSNHILRDSRLFNGSYDKMHYVDRVYQTVCILSNVLNMDIFIDYGKKSNKDAMELLTSGKRYDSIREESRIKSV